MCKRTDVCENYSRHAGCKINKDGFLKSTLSQSTLFTKWLSYILSYFAKSVEDCFAEEGSKITLAAVLP